MLGKAALLILLITFSLLTNAQEGTSYITAPNDQIVNIANVNREAEAWAMCAASYDLLSSLLKGSQPAQATYIADLANGAELAVMMAIVSRELLENEDISPAQFTALWSTAKTMMKKLPETSQKFLSAKIEQEGDKAIPNLATTVKFCSDNQESQQYYVDYWRELSKSGLFQLPSE
jgi:hypothetical protein